MFTSFKILYILIELFRHKMSNCALNVVRTSVKFNHASKRHFKKTSIDNTHLRFAFSMIDYLFTRANILSLVF